MIRFSCPHCACTLEVPDDWASQTILCDACDQQVWVPALPATLATTDVKRVRSEPPAKPAPPPMFDANETRADTGLPSKGNVADPSPLPRLNQGVGGLLLPPQEAGELGRLGPYRILEELGRGGMGIVFRAEDVKLKRSVALKVLLPAVAATDANRERFLREAQAAAALEHDHIVAIYQVGEDHGVPFLAMPLLRGESLEDRLQREKRLPVAEVVRIAREVAEGLAAAHERGLVHRDIKPANVWLEGERGRVKILDFGLARVATDKGNLTRPGAILGTPAYMAPEQARGETVDGRSDLFSLGCILYEMCAGQMAFTGPDPVSTLMVVASQEPRPVRELNPEVPPGLADLVRCLLAKNRDHRPQSAQVVLEALEAIAEGRTPLLGAPQGQRASIRRPLKRRVLLAAVALFTVLALAGLAFHYFSKS